MKAALLIESLTGNTQKAGDRIANDLQQVGWTITGVSRVKLPDFGSIQDADMIIVGTWVHGLFVVGQAPWGLGAISHLPAMQGKKAAVFCTFALSPGKTLDKLTSTVSLLGAEVIGGLALNRGKIEAHSEEFVTRLVDSVPVQV
jgi:menaquinone-dependent protoporphyrinogen IX oxidase